MSDQVKDLCFLLRRAFRYHAIPFPAACTGCFLLFSMWACEAGGRAEDEDIKRFKDTYLAHSFIPDDSVAVLATVVADKLEVPWELQWGADGWIWFTEQKGSVSRLNPRTGEQRKLLQLEDLVHQKSRGLFSLVLHPDFDAQPYVYLCYTYYQPDSTTSLRVVRYRYGKGAHGAERLEQPFVLMENIPGETYHNGSRLMISPDLKLFITTGDAGNMENAQNIHSLSGKILRLQLDGSVPEDNPFPGNPVWSWGHRNPQGLVSAANGKVYISDHGADNDDELNLLRKGRNYGWPDVMGYCDLPSEKAYCADSAIVEPLIAWSPVIAPAGMDYYAHQAIPQWQNSLILGSLKNQTLRVLHLAEEGEEIAWIEEWFPEVFGRIRAVCVSPEGDVYISSSNKDWHPRHFPAVYQDVPRRDDDKIIKISRAKNHELALLTAMPEPVRVIREASLNRRNTTEEVVLSGEVLYSQYCSGCHQTDGEGVEDLYPPLAGSEWVLEDKDRLIQVVLHGLSGPVEVKGKMYNEQMPAYRFLSDEQLSELLSYIRQNFGNEAPRLSPEEIAAARAS